MKGRGDGSRDACAATAETAVGATSTGTAHGRRTHSPTHRRSGSAASLLSLSDAWLTRKPADRTRPSHTEGKSAFSRQSEICSVSPELARYPLRQKMAQYAPQNLCDLALAGA